MVNKVWFGIGLYQSYLDRLFYFAEKLKGNDEIRFIIADSLQEYNISLKYQDRANKIKKLLLEQKNDLESKINGLTVHTWDFVSKNKRYMEILNIVRELYKREAPFSNKVREISSKKTKVEIDNPDINRLAQYVLEELSSIYYLGELSHAKVGPRDEKIYDKLAKETLDIYKEDLNLNLDNELRFKYIREK